MHESTLISWLRSPFQLAFLTRKTTYLVKSSCVHRGTLGAHHIEGSKTLQHRLAVDAKFYMGMDGKVYTAIDT